MHGHAVQADADRGRRPIEAGVVAGRGDDVRRRVSGDRAQDQTPDQQPGDGRVAVREMEVIGPSRRRVAGGGVAHALGALVVQTQALEARQAEAPAVQRRHPVDPQAPFVMGAILVERDGLRSRPDHLQQIVAVADAGQPIHLVGDGEARQVVLHAGLDAQDVGPHLV